MAITKKGFSGEVPRELVEERQRFQPDDQYGPSEGAQDLLKSMVGADTMNSRPSKGLPGASTTPAGAVPGSEQGPRRAGTAQPVPAGNDVSGSVNGPFQGGADLQPVTPTPSGRGSTVAKLSTPGPATTTGAGGGSKIVKTYGNGRGKVTGVGGIS